MASIFPFFGGGGAGMSVMGGVKLGIIIMAFLCLFGLATWAFWYMSKERLKIAILGVKGKVIQGVVYQKSNQKFVRIRGRRLPMIYPQDSCVIPIGKFVNMAVARQAGDDLVFYNIRDMKMDIGDNRLMRQQHAITLREVMEKYDTKSWFDKAAPYLGLAVFGIMLVVILVVGHKTICG